MKLYCSYIEEVVIRVKKGHQSIALIGYFALIGCMLYCSNSSFYGLSAIMNTNSIVCYITLVYLLIGNQSKHKSFPHPQYDTFFQNLRLASVFLNLGILFLFIELHHFFRVQAPNTIISSKIQLTMTGSIGASISPRASIEIE